MNVDYSEIKQRNDTTNTATSSPTTNIHAESIDFNVSFRNPFKKNKQVTISVTPPASELSAIWIPLLKEIYTHSTHITFDEIYKNIQATQTEDPATLHNLLVDALNSLTKYNPEANPEVILITRITNLINYLESTPDIDLTTKSKLHIVLVRSFTRILTLKSVSPQHANQLLNYSTYLLSQTQPNFKDKNARPLQSEYILALFNVLSLLRYNKDVLYLLAYYADTLYSKPHTKELLKKLK